MREPKTIDVLLLILLGAIWGSAFFNIKIATYTYDPITLVFVRVFFALLALVINCLVYTYPSPRDQCLSRMPYSA